MFIISLILHVIMVYSFVNTAMRKNTFFRETFFFFIKSSFIVASPVSDECKKLSRHMKTVKNNFWTFPKYILLLYYLNVNMTLFSLQHLKSVILTRFSFLQIITIFSRIKFVISSENKTNWSFYQNTYQKKKYIQNVFESNFYNFMYDNNYLYLIMCSI